MEFGGGFQSVMSGSVYVNKGPVCLFVFPRMKLRVRIQRQTSRVELPGGEPTLQELSDLIKQTLLVSHGLSPDTDFSLSLNGSELLSDSGQTLSSCGIVSGDLVCVLVPQPAPVATATPEKPTSSAQSTPSAQQTLDKTTCQVSLENSCFYLTK